MKIQKSYKFDSAHRLFKNKGLCRNIHGHTYKVVVELEGDNNQNDMVFDFADLGFIIKNWIDEYWDHAILLNRQDPLANMLFDLDGSLKIYLFKNDPTAEEMAKEFLEHLSFEIKNISKVIIYETRTSCAEISNS